MQQLQSELDRYQRMLQAKEEAEVLLKAENGRLVEESGRLHAEVMEQEGRAMGLQELLTEISEEGDAAKVCMCVRE